MPLATALASGFVLFAGIIVFGALMYRVVGIRPGALERRRLGVQLAAVGVIIAVLAVLPVTNWPGAEFYGFGLAALAYVGARTLQQRRHWLMTLTAEEQVGLSARRAAFAAARTRLLVLAAGFVLIVGILELAVVLATR